MFSNCLFVSLLILLVPVDICLLIDDIKWIDTRRYLLKSIRDRSNKLVLSLLQHSYSPIDPGVDEFSSIIILFLRYVRLCYEEDSLVSIVIL